MLNKTLWMKYIKMLNGSQWQSFSSIMHEIWIQVLSLPQFRNHLFEVRSRFWHTYYLEPFIQIQLPHLNIYSCLKIEKKESRHFRLEEKPTVTFAALSAGSLAAFQTAPSSLHLRTTPGIK